MSHDLEKVVAQCREATTQQDRQQLSAAERYPRVFGELSANNLIRGNRWPRGQALDVADALDELEPEIRAVMVDILAEPGVPPDTAQKLVNNVASKPKREQRAIVTLYRSDKREDRDLAKTRAIGSPPCPWYRLTWLRDGIRSLEKCLGDGHPEGEAEIRDAIASARRALDATLIAWDKHREREGWGPVRRRRAARKT